MREIKKLKKCVFNASLSMELERKMLEKIYTSINIISKSSVRLRLVILTSISQCQDVSMMA